MKKTNKKAFTIVELVIVIAVIAILAAVLIPTFSSLVERANRSADIQAVTQMNIALMAGSIPDKPDDIQDVIDILDEAGFNSKERLMPISKGHTFYWHSVHNVIILAKDEPAEVIHPKDNQDLVDDFAADLSKTGEAKVLYDLEDWYNDNNEGESGDNNATEVQVTGVSLDKSELSLNVGGSGALVATVKPDDATNPNVTWTSSDEDVATVADGVVTAVAPGTATITARAGDKTATCTVKVTETKNFVGIYLPSAVELYSNKPGKNTIRLWPQYAYKDNAGNMTYEDVPPGTVISWKKTDTDQVSNILENEDGSRQITAKDDESGVARVTATIETDAGRYTAACVVTVRTIEKIELSKSLAVLYTDGSGADTTELTAVYVCKDGATVDITDEINWSISGWEPDEVTLTKQKSWGEVVEFLDVGGSNAEIRGIGCGLVTVTASVSVVTNVEPSECKVIVGQGLKIDSQEKSSSFEMSLNNRPIVAPNSIGRGVTPNICIFENTCGLVYTGSWNTGYIISAQEQGTATIACIAGDLSYIGCSTIGVSAPREEVYSAEGLYDALCDRSEEVITLQRDIEFTLYDEKGKVISAVDIRSAKTINLNGHTLTLGGTRISVLDNLTINGGPDGNGDGRGDGTIVLDSKYSLETYYYNKDNPNPRPDQYNILNIQSCTVIAKEQESLYVGRNTELNMSNKVVFKQTGGTVAGLINRGTAIIDNCEFINENPDNNDMISNGTVYENKPIPGTMTISNTKISGTFEDEGMAVIWNNSGTLTFGENVEISADIPPSNIYHFDVVETDERYAECIGTAKFN